MTREKAIEIAQNHLGFVDKLIALDVLKIDEHVDELVLPAEVWEEIMARGYKVVKR